MTATLARKAFTPSEKAAPTRAVQLSPEGLVTAIVAVTGVVDAVGDLIVPGAFKASLAKRRPKVVDDHEWKNRRGRVLHAEEWMPGDPRLPKRTQSGAPWPAEAGALVATMQYHMDTPEGLNAWKWVKFYADSNEAEFSIGYTVPDGMGRRRSDGVRVILMVNLFEFSHVLFGANPLTMALEVKSLNGAAIPSVTVPAIAPTQKVGDDDDESTTPPLPADAVWDDNAPAPKRARMEAKTAAAVVLEAKTSEEAMTETKTLETKEFSRMKGSYEERREAIENAVKDLFLGLLSCSPEDLWAYPVATYPNEVVVNVCYRSEPTDTYLIPYSIEDGTVDVELGQPEKVTLSLVAEPAGEGEEAKEVEDEAVVDAATVFIPHLEAFAARNGIEKKQAQAAFALLMEGKNMPTVDPAYESEAREDGAPEPHGPVYDRENLPEGEWGMYQKKAAVKCTPMVGKYSVKTQEGLVNAEDGWLALDQGGHPYPIADKEFDASYVPHPDDPTIPETQPQPDPEADPEVDPEAAPEAPADEPPVEEEGTKSAEPDDEAAEPVADDEQAEGERVTIDPADYPSTLHDDEAQAEPQTDPEPDPEDGAEGDEDPEDEAGEKSYADEDDMGSKTDPKGEFEGKNELVTLDPDEHFSMRDELDSGLDSQLEDRDKNN